MSLILQVETPAAGAAAIAENVSATGTASRSFWSIIEQSNGNGGWIFNLILLLMFGYTIFLFVERFLALRKATKTQGNFSGQIKSNLETGNIAAAKALCLATDSPSARMIEKGISRLGKSMENISGTVENTGKLEILRLEQRLQALATCAGAAPMIGFLGTVFGMVIVFNDLSTKATLELKVIAPGMMTAMITTVGGLIVGIIGYVGYNYLCGQISKVVYQMENDAFEFMDIINAPSK